MELYLIRHGETVDNVAGLYAGVRDSALTNHGHQQARRLGEYLAKTNVKFTHIFASPLTRAFKTAEAIRSTSAEPVDITKVPELIEQDFGYYEGKPFHARSNAEKSGRESHREKHKDDSGFVDVESKESMNQRADIFLDEHIMPLFAAERKPERTLVAIVSHGMLLSHLWRRLLLRLPPKSLTVAPEVSAARGNIILQHLGGWSNTGYLELALSPVIRAVVADQKKSVESTDNAVPAPSSDTAASIPSDVKTETDAPTISSLDDWSILIRAIDSKAHLVGLKRQRGGIGRSAHDEGQKKLDGFFKRQRTS